MKETVSRQIHTRIVSVASYAMNVCDLNQKQIDDLDKMIKKARRDKGMHGRQASYKRLYLKVDGRRI